MADETRVVRTAGVSGEFRLPGLAHGDDGPEDLVITPDGIDVTRDQWLTVADAATTNHVIVRLDEDFPVQIAETKAPAAGDESPGEPSGAETKTEDVTSTGTSVDGGTPPPATSAGTSRKGR